MELRLNRPQTRAYEALRNDQTVCLDWGRGTGKSWFLRQMGWLAAARAREEGKPVRIIGLAPTLKQWRDIHEMRIIDEISKTKDDVDGPGWAFLGGKLDRTTLQIRFPDGSWWKPFPAEMHSSRSALGQRCDMVLIEEADDIPKSVFYTVTKPWFTEPWSRRQILAVGTPRLGRKGLLYDLYEKGQNRDPKFANYHSFHSTYLETPNQIAMRAAEDAMLTYPPAIFKREWLADFDAAEGLVFGDVYDERFHVRAPPAGLRFSEFLIGGDAGWEDPGVLLVIGVVGSGDDAVCWVLHEVYQRHQTADWWVAQMRQLMAWYPDAVLYHDPSRPDLVKSYQGAGARPRKVDNSIEAGIAALANRMKPRGFGDNRTARFYINPTCTNLIWELGAYRRKQDSKDPDRYLEEIVDKDNHAIDSARYCVISRFGRPPSYRTEVPGA